MRWWHGAFSSTSKPQSTEDSLTLEASGKWRSRLMRARKWRNSSEIDDILLPLSNPHTMTPAKPQPLPVPELRHLLHDHDPKSTFSSVPLPSPEAVLVPRGRERFTEGNIYSQSRLIDQDHLRMNMDHPKSRPARRSLEIQKTPLEKSSDIFNFNINIIPISAPTSPYGLSPPTNDLWSAKYPTPPGVFHVWSAPEMPHSDIGNLGFSCSSQTPPLGRNSTSSLDNSPLDSPRRVAARISSELMRWESNAQANVHPLPLPPPPVAAMSSSVVSRSDTSGATVPSHSVPISLLSSFGNKPEVVPWKSKWQKGKLIGRGTFGSVYVASNRETGALCAMKEVEILPDDSKSAECIRQLEQEIKVLQHLKHPNIVQYYGSEIVGDKFYIYLEYVHPGSINKFIQDHCGAITESVVRNFTRHILCGLAYLHSKKTIHRDIKGANLLVDAYGVVKLADFGMAKHLNGQTLNLSLKGTPHWLAPELLLSTTQTDASSDIALAVDIWSLGCTIIEMMDGKPPWSECEGAAALFKVLKESPPIPKTMSAEGKDFLQCCFRRNPADRPTAAELLDHPFVNYSHQPHASTQPLKEMKFAQDNVQFRRERTRLKSDQMHTAYDIRHDVLSNNFMHDYLHLLE